MTDHDITPDAGSLPVPGSDGFSDAEAAFISEMGSLMERWGLPQATGRLFGYLLLRNKPVDLDTMTRELGQAKSGLSVAARQLEAWSLVRRSTRKPAAGGSTTRRWATSSTCCW